jgi:hypothetical protein
VLYTNVFSSGGDKYKSSTKASKFEYDTDSGSFKWYTAPSGTAGNAISFTQAMTLNASGNLGVGTTSPGDYRLHVSKGAAGNIAQLTDGVANTFIIRSASNTLLIGEANNNPLAFVTNNTERARIDSSGNLLVGQTAGTAKVAITQAGAAQDTIAINIGSGGAGVAVVGSAAAMTSLYMQTSSGYAGAITNSGTTTTYATASDHRLKTDIQPMTGALAFVRKQRPVTYRWKADGSEGSGYIAHWMQEDGAGQCVTGNKDAVDADGKAVYQGIDTSFMVGPLNAALNELADIVDAQAAIIEQLKARLDAANL